MGDSPQMSMRNYSMVSMGVTPFKDPEESTNFVKKTFHTIYRSKSVSNVSNEMDPDGKTKILKILNIKLPH